MKGAYREQRCLYDFAQLLNLLLATTNVRVCYVWLLLDLHHCDRSVNLWWERDLNLVFCPVDTTALKLALRFLVLEIRYLPDSHTLLNICRRHPLTKPDDELSNLLDIDNVFRLLVRALLTTLTTLGVNSTRGLCELLVDGDNLGAACDLKRVFFAHSLAVSG